jgi:putative DNA primase/helicase
MSALDVARAFRGVKNGKNFLCRCPVATHGKGKGDRSPSLSVADGKNGRLLVRCFAGCDPIHILAELRDRGLTGSPPIKAAGIDDVVDDLIEPNAAALDLWRSGVPINGTKAMSYLIARSIIQAPPTLRFISDYEYIAGRVGLPAMVAALQAGDGRVIAVQVTMIDPRADRKAQVGFPRRTIGAMHDGAVRLAAAGEALGLAEGVESGLSAQHLFDIPVWCCLGAARMSSVTIPGFVRDLHVFADADEAGRTAVQRVVAKHRNKKIIAHYPVVAGADWNDIALGSQQNG